jgi:hypothetical protein
MAMLRALAWAGALLAGLGIGLLSALWSIEASAGASYDMVNGWRVSSVAGGPAGGLRERAAAARQELMGPSGREGRMYLRDRDDDGNRLDESCIYALEGRALPARWWSVTLYAPDHDLAANSDHAFSVHSDRLGAGRRWSVRIAPVRGEAANWLSSRAARRGFSLALRAYHANRGDRALEAALPSLALVSCPDRP